MLVVVRAGAAVLAVLGLIHGREADLPVLGRTLKYVCHLGFPMPRWLENSLVGRRCTDLHRTALINMICCLNCCFSTMLAPELDAHNNFGSRRSPVRIRPARLQPARPNTVSRSPVPSTSSSARTASVTGLSVSSSGSSGAFASAEPVAAASLTARSAPDNCRTRDGDACAPG